VPGFPGLGLLRGLRPHSDVITRQRTLLTALMQYGKGVEVVPTFTMNRLVGWCPTPPLQLRNAYAAGFPRRLLTNAYKLVWESRTHRARALLPQPTSARFGAGFPDLRSFHVGSLRTRCYLACRAQAVWQCRPVPSLFRAAPAIARASGVKLPSASSGCCDSLTAELSHLRSVQMAPRGARTRSGRRRTRPIRSDQSWSARPSPRPFFVCLVSCAEFRNGNCAEF
jgi:hypothetical protein